MGRPTSRCPVRAGVSYSFDVPSQETSLPAGWATLAFGSSSPPEPDWNQVITNVVELRFFYGDPTMFFIFQGWNLGLDNPTISYGLFDDGFDSGDTTAWSATVP